MTEQKYRVQINFSELHLEKSFFFLVSRKGPKWLGLEEQNILKFLHALDCFKNAISKCKLRLFEPL